MSLKLLSWNLNARKRVIHEQVAAIVSRDPALVTLQEVTAGSRVVLRKALADGGLKFFIDGFDGASSDLTGPRRYGLLIAARDPLVRLNRRFEVPWPERFLGAAIATRSKHLEVYTTHIPPGASNGWTKVEMLEGIYKGLASSSAVPRVLTGDFNAPQSERSDGDVITWGQKVRKDGTEILWRTKKGGSGERWDSAERNVLLGLARFDLADVYRRLNSYKPQEHSWYTSRKGVRVGRRFDHIFASSALSPISCAYIHEWREQRLSDHSAIETIFEW